LTGELATTRMPLSRRTEKNKAAVRFDLDREFPLAREDFEFIVRLATERTGIIFGDQKVDLVYARLSRRLRQLGLENFGDYVRVLKDDHNGDETAVLVNALTTNLTKFFRSQDHFDHLRDITIPNTLARVRARKSDRIRIWSAGCSTGEEPYSIAITAQQVLGNRLPGLDFRVLATDIDTNILERASSGVYSGSALAETAANDRERYFEALESNGETQWRIKNNVRSMVTFKKLNLLDAWPFRGQFDAVMCRNVMIYFDLETKMQLVNRFTNVLRPGGWLYLGSSESMTFSCPGLSREGNTIYRWQD